MDADLDDLRDKAKTISIDTITKRLTASKALRDKAHTYADLLGTQQETMSEQLATLTAKAQAVLLDAGDDADDDELADDDAPLAQTRADHVVTPGSVDEAAPSAPNR